MSGHRNWVYSLAVLQNGYLVSGSGDQSIMKWDCTTGSLNKTLQGHSDPARSLAVLLNGDLATGSDDKTIKIWNQR